MAGTPQTTTLQLSLMKEILEDLRTDYVLESKFERRMRTVQQSANWNPRGILTPYETELDYNHFAVGEGGVIQGGGTNNYQTLKASMRSLWKSVNITGELARIRSEQFINLQQNPPSMDLDEVALGALAENRAIELILKREAQVYTKWKNFYAINGSDKSALGVVTGAPAGNVVPFAWTSSDLGNRFLQKGMKVQFYDTSATALRRLSADYAAPRSESEQYSVVSAFVDPRASVNIGNNGAVTFDVLPTVALAAGDTVHTLQGYGAMPQGFFYWVSDTGNLQGQSGSIARSVAPHIFCSEVQNNAASTANTPTLMLAMESRLRARVTDNEPVNLELWMNKAQVYAFQLFALNSSNSTFNVQRFTDLAAPQRIDVGVPHTGLSLNNMMLEEDRDIPPNKIMWIDWLGWTIDVNMPDTLYNFHQDQQMIQALSAYGEPIDQKQLTLFSQYNNRCVRFKTQGYQDNLAFDSSQVGQA